MISIIYLFIVPVWCCLVVVIPTRKAASARYGGGGNAIRGCGVAPYQDTSPTSPLQQLFITPMRNVFGGGGNSNNGSSYFKFSNTLSDDVRRRLTFKNGEW